MPPPTFSLSPQRLTQQFIQQLTLFPPTTQLITSSLPIHSSDSEADTRIQPRKQAMTKPPQHRRFYNNPSNRDIDQGEGGDSRRVRLPKTRSLKEPSRKQGEEGLRSDGSARHGIQTRQAHGENAQEAILRRLFRRGGHESCSFSIPPPPP